MWGASTDLYFRVDKLLNQLAKPSDTLSAAMNCASYASSVKDQAPQSAFVFVTERGGPFTPESFNHMVKRAGQKAKLPFQVHAHMLGHSTGYKASWRRSRHPFDPGLSRPQGYQAHGALYGTIPEAVRGTFGAIETMLSARCSRRSGGAVERSPLT